MRATGIVRRIDELGRVVIPKEIRNTMRIREGVPLEIFTSGDGEIVFKKYSPVGEVAQVAASLCEAMSKTSGNVIAITDTESIIAVSGKKALLDKTISKGLLKLLEQRRRYVADSRSEKIGISKDMADGQVGLMEPVLANGDLMGSVVVLFRREDEVFGEKQQLLAKTAAEFMARQLEI